jgi:hypothetical protein
MTMRKLALLGASALVLALGVASASAEPTTAQIMSRGQTAAPSATVHEGRAAAVEGSANDSVILQSRSVR